MRVIDLSRTLEDGMPAYPGDPPVRLTQVHHLETEGWRLRELHLGSHSGTHVDAPAHMDEHGATLDTHPLGRFFGPAQVIDDAAAEFRTDAGLIFRTASVDLPLLERIVAARARFVAVGENADFPVPMERALLRAGILTYTGLVNLEQLPAEGDITFYGIPLKIKDGDGSPVRAFVTVR